MKWSDAHSLHLVHSFKVLHFSHTVDERDRIALLTYNTSVKQHFGLQEATAENKQMFRNAISTIIADGRTNLCDGLMKGKYNTIVTYLGSITLKQ